MGRGEVYRERDELRLLVLKLSLADARYLSDLEYLIEEANALLAKQSANRRVAR